MTHLSFEDSRVKNPIAVQRQNLLYWAIHVMWRIYFSFLISPTETISKQSSNEHSLSLLVTYDTIMIMIMINIY